MYQNVLVPVNGTEISETAIPHALELAEKHDAVIHALCAYNREGGYGSLSIESAQRQEEDLQDRAQEIATAVADRAEDEGIEAVSAVSSGDPADSILDYIDEKDIDIVAIGARKRSPTGKLLFGSVTQTVLLHANIPVVVTGSTE
ncbi:Nucleotide-binding universal stress protein, UspA family [Natronorubrum sediminis]|uniref:Nucleotide-binding universal stress protein, UspA family n=1 Tax=Natronorubrum sediminis TaxID=640943 RepID=A0A1H6G4W1_9EURY|nr:universal stress protein [Natronorubrum sediminis]SEH18079.1 Nucleotide-binding universal stress protein, UspA family [Natronorubrum sediminis]